MTDEYEFEDFGKIPRLNREIVVTEKIDGTNAQVFISDDLKTIKAGSRSRWLTLKDDNYSFAKWVEENKDELLKLGAGRHFGEWWGGKIQKRYTIPEKRFYLFNVSRWTDDAVRPACCGVVPILYEGLMSQENIKECMEDLRLNGSKVDPDCKNPEGIIIYHKAANIYFKATLFKDEEWKGKDALSSNGRTADFESVNDGSNPSEATI